jgi:hypothetical protein
MEDAESTVTGGRNHEQEAATGSACPFDGVRQLRTLWVGANGD